jgi:hypothetical protein
MKKLTEEERNVNFVIGMNGVANFIKKGKCS